MSHFAKCVIKTIDYQVNKIFMGYDDRMCMARKRSF